MDNLFQLQIQDENHTHAVDLPSEGVLIGRSEACDIQLSSREIAEKHARLFQDPFGRWVIETAQSDAALCVNNKQGEAFSVRPGDRITMGPYLMYITKEMKRSIMPPKWQTGAIVDDDRQTLTHERESRPEFSPARFENLDRITNSLANLTDVKDLYPEACKHLTQTHDTIALVVKVPKPGIPLVHGTKIIAHCQSAEKPENRDSSPPSIHLSRTVLEAVRTKKTALSATSEAENLDERLSLIDDLAPRMVLAAPIAETRTGIDVLYMDQSALIAPSDALGFFAIVARMVNLTRKTLIMAEERAERKLLDHQISTAKEIQSNLTPKKLDLFDNVELALHYRPALWVGGDYCDVCVSADNRLVFAIGDVTGKGLPAAMVMANLQAMLRSILLFNSNPQVILNKINEMLCGTLLDGMFITLLLGFFDPDSGELEYVNAGHELPLIISQTGEVRQLGEPVNFPLGIIKGEYMVQQHRMMHGEGLLAVSDGVTETVAPSSELFGVDNLLETVRNAQPQSGQTLVDSVVAATNEFRGPLPPSDDLTVLTLKWR